MIIQETFWKIMPCAVCVQKSGHIILLHSTQKKWIQSAIFTLHFLLIKAKAGQRSHLFILKLYDTRKKGNQFSYFI